MTERDEAQRACEDYLNLYHGVKWWYVRLNAGGIPTEGGHYIRLAPKGTADGAIFGSMPCYEDALQGYQRKSCLKEIPRTIFLEYKSSKGKLTEGQETFRKFIEDLGYEYYVIRSLDDLLAIEGIKGV
jgi:hypothetical protein